MKICELDGKNSGIYKITDLISRGKNAFSADIDACLKTRNQIPLYNGIASCFQSPYTEAVNSDALSGGFGVFLDDIVCNRRTRPVSV
jgi:hypothetical protein